jgi:hypothetical protein
MWIVGRRRACAIALLDGVRQLMSQECAAGCRVRRVLAAGEHHVPSHRIRTRIHGMCRFCRACIGMHPHPAEVLAEARFHEGADGGIQRLPAAIQYRANDGWHIISKGGRVTRLHQFAHRPIARSMLQVQHVGM